MGIHVYYVSKVGKCKIARNFRVREFQCKDGTDKVLIDDKLIDLLQKIRDHFAAPVTITSAYRTAAHNKAVGGSTYSKHMSGQAADIKVSGVSPKEVARYCERIGVKGIGLYSSFTHVDTRSVKSYWKHRDGTSVTVTSFK